MSHNLIILQNANLFYRITRVIHLDIAQPNVLYSGAFLVPYFFFVIVTAIPIVTLEAAVGQWSSIGFSEAWGCFVPRFKGEHYEAVCVCVCVWPRYVFTIRYTFKVSVCLYLEVYIHESISFSSIFNLVFY